jgi:putative DNA primase/helicase
VVRWKARGQHLSQEARTELLAQAAEKRYARRQAEEEVYEATAKRLADDLRAAGARVDRSAYHEAKGIGATAGAPVRNGDVLVPGYDVDGKLWTIQYIKENGTKRFAKESRKHGCFHVVGASNAAKDSGVAGGSNRGRVCNSSDDCETRKSSGDRGVRFREPVSLKTEMAHRRI